MLYHTKHCWLLVALLVHVLSSGLVDRSCRVDQLGSAAGPSSEVLGLYRPVSMRLGYTRNLFICFSTSLYYFLPVVISTAFIPIYTRKHLKHSSYPSSYTTDTAHWLCQLVHDLFLWFSMRIFYKKNRRSGAVRLHWPVNSWGWSAPSGRGDGLLRCHCDRPGGGAERLRYGEEWCVVESMAFEAVKLLP